VNLDRALALHPFLPDGLGLSPPPLALISKRIHRRERRRTKQTLRFDPRPRENALRSARTNLTGLSPGRKDADHKPGGPRFSSEAVKKWAAMLSAAKHLHLSS